MAARHAIANCIDVAVPGSGLILLGRDTLGVTIAVLFATCGHVAIAGFLLYSNDWPVVIPFSATGGAALLWLASRVLLNRRLRQRDDPERFEHLLTCYQLADAAVADERYDDAYGALEVAATVDDENLETYLRLARLAMAMGRDPEARAAWQRVSLLDRGQAFQDERGQALARLDTRSGRVESDAVAR